MWRMALKQVKRVIVAVIGGTVVLFGIVLIFTPGPALVVIPVGLAILGLEFAWARRWITKVKAMAKRKNHDTNEPDGVVEPAPGDEIQPDADLKPQDRQHHDTSDEYTSGKWSEHADDDPPPRLDDHSVVT
ncbi:MAG: PGPGW domain-containing protein [Phycisphaerales bacterium]